MATVSASNSPVSSAAVSSASPSKTSGWRSWTSAFGRACGVLLKTIVRWLALSRINPNVLTFMGLVVNTWAAYYFGSANAANQKRRLSGSERVLAIYFRVLSFILAALHLMKFGERLVLLKMTTVLEYFANVLGDRIKRVRFGGETASEYLMGL